MYTVPEETKSAELSESADVCAQDAESPAPGAMSENAMRVDRVNKEGRVIYDDYLRRMKKDATFKALDEQARYEYYMNSYRDFARENPIILRYIASFGMFNELANIHYFARCFKHPVKTNEDYCERQADFIRMLYKLCTPASEDILAAIWKRAKEALMAEIAANDKANAEAKAYRDAQHESNLAARREGIRRMAAAQLAAMKSAKEAPSAEPQSSGHCDDPSQSEVSEVVSLRGVDTITEADCDHTCQAHVKGRGYHKLHEEMQAKSSAASETETHSPMDTSNQPKGTPLGSTVNFTIPREGVWPRQGDIVIRLPSLTTEDDHDRATCQCHAKGRGYDEIYEQRKARREAKARGQARFEEQQETEATSANEEANECAEHSSAQDESQQDGRDFTESLCEMDAVAR
jgi:hypothetical protein